MSLTAILHGVVRCVAGRCLPQGRHVSYVAAFRQLSIPIGVAFGILVLKEPRHAPRLVGVAVMLAGLILVAVG